MDHRQQAETALQENSALFWHLFDNMSSGVAIYEAQDGGEDFLFVGLNRAAEQISRLSREDVIGKQVMELFPTVKTSGLLDVFQQVWRTGEPEHHPQVEFQEGRFAGWLENYVYKLPSGQIVAIFDDISARKQAEDQLNRQNEFLERVIEALDHPFYVIQTTDFSIEIANSVARKLNGGSEITTCYALTHKRDWPCTGPDHTCPMEQVLQTKQPVTLEHIHFNANGVPHPVEVHGYPLFDEEGNVERMIEYTVDITERKLSERVAKNATAAAERARLARDLHDAVSQNLFSAGLIAELLPELWEIDPAEGRNSLAKLRQLIRATSAEMRTMLLELRPDRLTEASLSALLEHLSEMLASRASVSVETNLDTGCDVPVDVKITLYRLVQEAFNNIAKHAQATTVQLVCRCDAGQVEINVQDDGRGFDPNAVFPGHMGVRIMHERVAQIGGTLIVESEPGQGTKTAVIWQRQGAENE